MLLTRISFSITRSKNGRKSMETEINPTQDEVPEAIVSEETISRCRFLGSNLNKLFKIKNASLAVTIAIVILYLFWLYVGIRMSLGFMYVMLALVIILALGLLGTSIAMIVILFRMGKYNDGFKYAVLFIIISFIISLFSFFVDSIAVPLLTPVFPILSTFKYINTMALILNPVNKKLASGWGNLQLLYIYTLIAAGVSIIMGAISSARDLSAFVLYVCLFAMLVAKIWEINLIYDSAKAMNSYPNTSEPPQADTTQEQDAPYID